MSSKNTKKLTFQQEFRLVGFFYILSIIYWIAVGLMAAYWVLYFLSLDFSYTWASIIFLTDPLAALIFEVPTGAIADLFGRKLSVGLSFLFTGLAYIGVLLSGSNLSFVLLFKFLAGISYTLESGALESWFIDSVNHSPYKNQLEPLLGHWKSFSSIGFIIGPLLGALIVNYGFALCYWITAVIFIILGLYVFIFGQEKYFTPQRFNLIKSFRQTIFTIKQSAAFIYQRTIILKLIVAMFLFNLFNMLYFYTYTPYVANLGLTPKYIGLALSLSAIISLILLYFSHIFTKKLGGDKKALFLFTLITGISIIMIYHTNSLPIIFAFITLLSVLYEFASGQSPIYLHLFNLFVPSSHRATIISIESLISNIGVIIGTLSFGLISDYFGLQVSLLVSAIGLILASLIYLTIPQTTNQKMSSVHL